jgi:hypothetical protein
VLNVAESVLVLKNDGEFYKNWERLVHEIGSNPTSKEAYRFRTVILSSLKRNHMSSGLAEHRETIRIEIARDWNEAHFGILPHQQPTAVPQQQPNPVSPIKQEENMSNQNGIAKQSVEIKTITYLNNVDISTLSKEQLIDAIAQCEADLERLSGLKTQSKAITAKRESIQATIDQLVSILDQE